MNCIRHYAVLIYGEAQAVSDMAPFGQVDWRTPLEVA